MENKRAYTNKSKGKFKSLANSVRLTTNGKVIDIEKTLKNRDKASTRDNTWLSFGDAITLIYPSTCDDLFKAKALLNSKEFDRKAFRNGRTYYNVFSIVYYLKKLNEKAFLETKTLGKVKGKEHIVHEGVKQVKRIKATPKIFNTLARHRGKRDLSMNIEEVKVVKYLPYETYRQYYGINMFNNFIKHTFFKLHDLEESTFDFLMYATNYKFFTSGDVFSFWGSKKISNVGIIASMEKLGYIELAKKSNARKKSRRMFLHLYRTTKKANDLLEEFMQYQLFKKKLPFVETSHQKTYNKFALRLKVQGPWKARYFRAYASYSYFFEYVALAETENTLGYKDEEIEKAMKETLSDYKFSSFMYLTLNELYKKDKISAFTMSNVKKFLSRDVFADSGWKFVYNKKKNKSELKGDYVAPSVPDEVTEKDTAHGSEVDEFYQYEEGVWTN